MGIVAAFDQSFSTVKGKIYDLTYVISSYSLDTTNASVHMGTTQGSYDVLLSTISSDGSKSHSFVALSTTTWILFTSPADTTFLLDDVSVKSAAITSAESLAVSFKDGFEPRFNIDGVFFAEGDSTVSPDDTDTTTIDVGNDNALTTVVPFYLKQVALCNRPLTDRELRALHEQAKWINRQ
jgi:hypothetical protein